MEAFFFCDANGGNAMCQVSTGRGTNHILLLLRRENNRKIRLTSRIEVKFALVVFNVS